MPASNLIYRREFMGTFPKDPRAKRNEVYGDMLFCYEYLNFEFKSPEFLDFGIGGIEISRVRSRGETTFFMSFTTDSLSCLEILFRKYVTMFKLNKSFLQDKIRERIWSRNR